MASFDPFESFDILANYGRPTAGGDYPVSPTGGLLDQVLASMRGGGLLNRYDAVGRSPGESPANDVATAAIPAPPPMLPLPQALPQDQGSGSVLGGLGNWLGNNSSTLMGLGAGIAGGRSWGEGLGKGLQNAMSGRALDQQRAGQNQSHDAARGALAALPAAGTSALVAEQAGVAVQDGLSVSEPIIIVSTTLDPSLLL
jgi:hypothetical protein